ncbi:unnamed protein product [Peniophora sp. CBMAI 1063]|nr:unnamed protein product [Peniophora sp. CBMAI 1063]
MLPTVPRLTAHVAGQPFKRSQLGLFHGKMIQFGNNVPFSLRKTRRTWLPNVQSKHLFSDTLNKHVHVKLTTTALKTIKKYPGGLDEYVASTRHELLGHEGMRLRLAIREASDAQTAPEAAYQTAREEKHQRARELSQATRAAREAREARLSQIREQRRREFSRKGGHLGIAQLVH